MRDVDDKIIYALNTTIPTESFKGQSSANTKCTDLYSTLNSTYESRNNIITKCIAVTANRVKELKTKKGEQPDDIIVYKNFKSEQRKVINTAFICFDVSSHKSFICLFTVAIAAVRIEC